MEWDLSDYDETADSGWRPTSDPEQLEDRWNWAIDRIREKLPAATEHEVETIAGLMLAAMEFADEEAFAGERWRQAKRSRQAIGRRQAQSQEKRHEILAAFHTAARAGGEINVDAIAKQCGCSRSTVYRALALRPPGGSGRKRPE